MTEASLRKFLTKYSMGTKEEIQEASDVYLKSETDPLPAFAKLLRCVHQPSTSGHPCRLVRDAAVSDKTGTCTLHVKSRTVGQNRKNPWAACQPHHMLHHLHKTEGRLGKISRHLRTKLSPILPAGSFLTQVSAAMGPKAAPDLAQRTAAQAVLDAHLQCRMTARHECVIQKSNAVTQPDLMCQPRFDYKKDGAPWLHCVRRKRGRVPRVPPAPPMAPPAPAAVPLIALAAPGAADLPFSILGSKSRAGPVNWTPPAWPRLLTPSKLKNFDAGPTRDCAHDYIQSCGKDASELAARCGTLEDSISGDALTVSNCVAFPKVRDEVSCTTLDTARGVSNQKVEYDKGEARFERVHNFSHPFRGSTADYTDVEKTPFCVAKGRTILQDGELDYVQKKYANKRQEISMACDNFDVNFDDISDDERASQADSILHGISALNIWVDGLDPERRERAGIVPGSTVDDIAHLGYRMTGHVYDYVMSRRAH